MAKTTPQICIIGAGISGLCMAVKLKLELKLESFFIYETNVDIGGTWLVNTYPGCSCDIPGFLYCFSFAPNYDCSNFYPSQPEILGYLKAVTSNYDIYRHIRFQSQIQSVSWNEKQSKWETIIYHTKSKRTIKKEFDIIINGTGQLRQLNVPKEYLHFQGNLLHSAKWDHSVLLAGKRVGIIGTGASAVQIITAIAPEVNQLVIFQRTAPYVFPRIEFKIPNLVKILLSKFPSLYKLIRSSLFCVQEFLHGVTQYNSWKQRRANRLAIRYIKSKISDPILYKKLKPKYAITHKRVILSKSYYTTLLRPNVALITEKIKQVKGNCITTVDESIYELDVLVLATGFKPQDFFAPMQIYGRQGVDILAEWKQNKPSTYLGIMSWEMPNLFTFMGPYTQIGHNSNIISIESQANWIINAIKTMIEIKSSVVSIRKQAEKEFMLFVEENFRNRVWAYESCNSWYLNENGDNIMLWPLNQLDYCKLCSVMDRTLFEFS